MALSDAKDSGRNRLLRYESSEIWGYNVLLNKEE